MFPLAPLGRSPSLPDAEYRESEFLDPVQAPVRYDSYAKFDAEHPSFDFVCRLNKCDRVRVSTIPCWWRMLEALDENTSREEVATKKAGRDPRAARRRVAIN